MKFGSVRWTWPVVLAVALAAASARADAPTGMVPPAERPRSIHEIEALAHRVQVDSPWARRPPAATPRARAAGSLTHEVHGYHPWWLGTLYQFYDWSLLSTVAFFSLELDATGAIVEKHGWPWTTLVNTAHQNGVRAIATATLFSAAQIDVLLSDPVRRQAAVTNLVAEVQAAGADGINLDLEGVPGARKQDLVLFVGELQAALGAALAAPYLSVATPAVDWSDAYDYDELAARCDHLMVMAYDYHWTGSAFAGPVAPLGGWGLYDVPWTVQQYQTWGTLPDQMLLGVPYYGYRWSTASGAVGAATSAAGVARTYAQAIADAEQHGMQWDAPSSTAWSSWQDGGWQQLWFDDDASLQAKYELVQAEGLAGVGIWALGYDGTRPELWSALAQSFSGATGVPNIGAGPETSAASTLWLAGANPFRDSVAFLYSLPAAGNVRLSVYDVAGRRVSTLLNGRVAAGTGRASWNVSGRSDVAPGTYYVKLQHGDATSALRIVRLR